MWAVTENEHSQSFDAVPPGLYRATVSSIELKATKAGNGKYFNVALSIVTPDEYAGAPVQAIFNWENANPQAVKIGQLALLDFLHACGVKANTERSILSLPVGKELLVEVSSEVSTFNGREYTNNRLVTNWTLKGAHRNEKRSLKDIKLGPNGKQATAAKARTGAPSGGGMGVSPATHDDVPF